MVLHSSKKHSLKPQILLHYYCIWRHNLPQVVYPDWEETLSISVKKLLNPLQTTDSEYTLILLITKYYIEVEPASIYSQKQKFVSWRQAFPMPSTLFPQV